MNQVKGQEKVAVEHLEDSKSATFSEDTEPAQQHRGIDQEIARFAAQHAVEIDDETNGRLLKLINKRVLLVMLVSENRCDLLCWTTPIGQSKRGVGRTNNGYR
jgi:hypothetical protein